MDSLLRCFQTIILLILLLSPTAFGQTQAGPGQYTEEAPLGSWNIFGLETASSLGSGLCQMARVGPASILVSPAVTSLNPGTSFSLNLSFNQTQLFKYWLVNTGVLKTNGNLPFRCWQLDYLGLSQKISHWTLGFGWALTENYGRPGLDYNHFEEGVLYNQLNLWQNGHQTNYAFSLARELNRRLSLGVSFIWYRGHLERNLEESWPVDNIKMIDYRYQKIKGFYPVFGLSYILTDWLFVALSLIPAHERKVHGQNNFNYDSPQTDIEIVGQASDIIKRPLITGLGARVTLRPNLSGYLEAVYFTWKNYSFSYFGETQTRNFRNVVRLGTGIEYRTKLRFLGRLWTTPYFLGLTVDPQPMTEVSSTYFFLTFGSGISTDLMALSFSTAIGLETGSGQHLKHQRISITLEFYPDLRKTSGENKK
ncbi:MAG: hypothetical protein PHQ25_03010 [Acidobacteriota bacterium]|nr:hypothetical protein [Acidobacteriota bacterium]MDW3228902.1 hypothetical protein [Acidobacteriota bacterium]